MIVLTLIQTSQNRFDDVKRFVDSLNRQENLLFSSIQYIFLDQGDNKNAFKNLNKAIDFKYISISPCSLSHARNLGLKHVKGKFIGFPDDDCWYESNTLSLIIDRLKEYDGVSAKGLDERGNLTNNFPHKGTFIISRYHHYGAISYTIFLRFFPNVYFDENIGVGSSYGLHSGEETDYIIQVQNIATKQMIYDSSIIVHHPLNGLGNYCDLKRKTYFYARGHGYIMRKNNYPFIHILLSLVRPIVGVCLYFFVFKFARSIQSYLLLKGRIEGLNIYSRIRKCQ